MCGIFGLVTTKEGIKGDKVKGLVDDLLCLSESRGKDSSGIAFVKDKEIVVYKESLPAHKFIKTPEYTKLLSSEVDQYALIGHARMETNGSFALSNNNQPVIKDGVVTIHNGIIVNDATLWKKHKNLERLYQVDTEVFNSILRGKLQKDRSLFDSVRFTLKELEGAWTFGSFFEDYNSLLLATNTGSLFTLQDKAKKFLVFASEKRFLEEVTNKHFMADKEELVLKQVEPNNIIFINLASLSQEKLSLNTEQKSIKIEKIKIPRDIVEIGKITTKVDASPIVVSNKQNYEKVEKLINDEYKKDREVISRLQRCTKCILPETMPFIEFDDKGVCNYCRGYQKREVKGEKDLEKEIVKYRKGNGEVDCIVPFSGGRDSCYALHYAVKELGLKPLAYSYDWGMITDLGRRNQARMTGQLGVEHILISADIQKKREYVRKNVTAWLKDPQIGMIPLFMAGDKQYFAYLNKLRQETKVDLILYAGNSLENTYFKHGFANVKLKIEDKKAYEIGMMSSLKLLWYYTKNYLTNPGYLNSSLLDTASAFISSYGIPKDYLYLYKYIPWSEEVVEKTLFEKYDWELATDTKSSWRIGDGTASFYNYIYYVMTGFTENDTFRSNQIREGLINREEALRFVLEENKPRLESMVWYCDTIGLNALEAVSIINTTKKIYDRDT